MEGDLNGEVIIDKLGDDFSILDQFHIIEEALKPIYFSSCVELEVLQREMVNFELPLKNKWNKVENFGKMKYIVYNDAQHF
jgi:hypothetical protein